MSDLTPLSSEPRPGLYRHYKGHHYRVICLARHTETEEVLVVYGALYGDYGVWVRPRDMFVETIEFNGKSMLRFERIGD